MSHHVVVVGAGPGGLTAAVLLAKAGVRVTVVERLPYLGGRTSTFTQNGFCFDHGPTFFHYPQVLENILRSAGYNLWRELDLIRLDPHYRLVFGSGGELMATSDLHKLQSAVAQMCPRDASRISAFLLDNRKKLDCFRPFLESPFHTWRDTFRLKTLGLLPVLKPWRSLDSELTRYFSDPRVRLAFSFQSKYLGMSPFECPSLFTILSFLEYEYGVYHPRGGCGSVSATLGRIAKELGATIRLNEPVTELLIDGRRAVGVRTSHATYKADAIVLNADFARAMTRLVPDHLRSRWRDRKLAKKSMSCSAFMMYLGLRGRYEDIAHHTIYMAKDYARNMRDIGKTHTLSEDPSYYVQNACVTDPGLAPLDKSTFYVLVPVTHQTGSVDWERERPRYRELVLNKLSEIGATDIRSRIEYERIITPSDWDTGFELYKGAVFGLAHTWSQMLHLRPGNRFREIERMYLVGGSTHPGSGLPVIFESARISSRLLLEDFGVPSSRSEVPAQEPTYAGAA
ncbi:MAG: phytoene desaturase [Acidobacteriaceae bacterium]|nr:phytoene desaturase [Acidobacteriaceae bacterium]